MNYIYFKKKNLKSYKLEKETKEKKRSPKNIYHPLKPWVSQENFHLKLLTN